MARGQWGAVLGQKHPIKVNIKWANDANQLQTGFHLRSAALEIGDVADVISEVQDFVTNSFVGLIGAECQILGADAVDLVTGEGASWSPTGLTGSVTTSGNQSPMFLCYTVSLKGELRRKYGQGRMFWPATLDTWHDQKVMTSLAAANGVVTAMTNRWIGNTVDGYNLINVHGELPALPATESRPARPVIPPSWYDVTSLRVNSRLTFLRSRKAGVGS